MEIIWPKKTDECKKIKQLCGKPMLRRNSGDCGNF